MNWTIGDLLIGAVVAIGVAEYFQARYSARLRRDAMLMIEIIRALENPPTPTRAIDLSRKPPEVKP